MKNRTILALAVTTLMFSCNQNSNKEVKEANQHLKEANQKLEAAKRSQDEAYREKVTADWNGFKKESDSLIVNMENDLIKMEVALAKANGKNSEKLKSDYLKTKSDLSTLKAELHERNLAFENNIKKMDHQMYEKNESFKREFKHDADELMKSLQDFFKDNVK
nr:hypothetical protein [uncultured Fluviicola sp.]